MVKTSSFQLSQIHDHDLGIALVVYCVSFLFDQGRLYNRNGCGRVLCKLRGAGLNIRSWLGQFQFSRTTTISNHSRNWWAHMILCTDLYMYCKVALCKYTSIQLVYCKIIIFNTRTCDSYFMCLYIYLPRLKRIRPN